MSALYPATLALYRSLGWELAGGLEPPHDPVARAPLAGRSRRGRAGGRPAGRTVGQARTRGCAGVGPGDAAEVLTVTGRVHQALRDCGPNTRDEPAVARWLGDE